MMVGNEKDIKSDIIDHPDVHQAAMKGIRVPRALHDLRNVLVQKSELVGGRATLGTLARRLVSVMNVPASTTSPFLLHDVFPSSS